MCEPRPGPEAVLACYPALCRAARALWRRHAFVRGWYGSVEDLCQASALYALLYGLPHWREGMGVSTEFHLVRNGTRQAVREAGEKSCRRVPLLYRAAVPDPPAPDDVPAAALARLDVAEALGVLLPAERALLEAYYGLGGDAPRDATRIAREWGLSRSTVSDRLAAARDRLRLHFRVSVRAGILDG